MAAVAHHNLYDYSFPLAYFGPQTSFCIANNNSVSCTATVPTTSVAPDCGEASQAPTSGSCARLTRCCADAAGLTPMELYANHHGYCVRNSNNTLTCWGIAVGAYANSTSLSKLFSKATNIGTCADYVSDNADSYACYNGAAWFISSSLAARTFLYSSLFAGASGSNVMRGLYGMGYFNAHSLTVW